MVSTSTPLYPCPACGFAVFSGPYGSLEACGVCRWVDDLVQLAQPDFGIGANSGLSLRQAQSAALAVYPVAVKKAGGFSRHPAWRPLSPGEHPETGAHSLASPVCYMTVPDLEDFEPYWLTPPPADDRDA
jgi:hypothetical protein